MKYNVKICDDSKLTFCNPKISSKYCDIYNDLFWYKYATLFGKDCIKVDRFMCGKPFVFANEYSKYYFVTNINFNIKYTEQLSKKNIENVDKNKGTSSRMYKLLQKIFSKKKQIMHYIPQSRYFFETYETYNLPHLIKNNNKICILGTDKYNFSDLEVYRYMKQRDKHLNLTFDINVYRSISYSELIKTNKKNMYFFSDYTSQLYKTYRKDINNVSVLTEYLGNDLLENGEKYNIIISYLSNWYRITPNFLEIDNINCNFFSLLYAITNLKKMVI